MKPYRVQQDISPSRPVEVIVAAAICHPDATAASVMLVGAGLIKVKMEPDEQAHRRQELFMIHLLEQMRATRLALMVAGRGPAIDERTPRENHVAMRSAFGELIALLDADVAKAHPERLPLLAEETGLGKRFARYAGLIFRHRGFVEG